MKLRIKQKVIKCDTHGAEEWKGHTICDACGTVFSPEQFKKRFEIHYGYCTCHANLTNTGYAICSQCYAERTGKNGATDKKAKM